VPTNLLPLRQLIQGRQIASCDILRYALHIGAALRRIHAEGRCHGALTPELIQVSASSARLLPAPAEGWEKPTPYTAPEVLRGETVDTRTDIFAFGAVLYEMATGRCAFVADDGETPAETRAISLAPIGHEGLDETVKRCLAEDPEARWQTMQKVMMELKLLAIAGQQREISTVSTLQASVGRELRQQAQAITELERAVAARTEEVTQAVTAALTDVQSQFSEVETFLTASQKRADDFAQSAARAVEATRRDIATLKVELAGEIEGLAGTAKGHTASIASMQAAMARSEDYVERVVDLLDGLQQTIFVQTGAQEDDAVSIAS